MAGIEQYLDLIKNAIYGKDVRQAIHDGIKQCYYDASGKHYERLERIKVNQPLDEYYQPVNGTSGQSLRTKGDGSTEWADVGLPTDEQTETAINAWLDEHPEATTTVLDGSLTEAKLTNSLKYEVLNGYVTPEMFGAVGDGIADDTQAFKDVLSSEKSIVIPSHSYNLSEKIFDDDANVISNDGIFPNENLILSRKLGDATPFAKVYRYVPFSDLNIGAIDFQSAAYDNSRDRIVLGFAPSENESYLVAVSPDFSTVILNTMIVGYHLNDLTYNSNTDKIYGATMDSTNQIVVINPQTLAFEEYINVGFAIAQISYDEQNDIFYVLGDNKINVFDSEFTLLKAYPFSKSNIINAIGKFKEAGISGKRAEDLVNQASVVLDGQFCLISNGTEYAKYAWVYLTQFNYKDGDVKKVYGWTPYGNMEEVETVIDVDGTLFALGYEYSPISRLVVTRISLSEQVAIQSPSIFHDDGNLLLRTDGLETVSDRCEIVKGGFTLLGDFVFIQLHVRILMSLAGNNYWSIIKGFTKPDFYCVFPVSGASTRGNPFTAGMDGGGVLTIKNDDALSSGDELYITGMYLRYLYNQGDR